MRIFIPFVAGIIFCLLFHGLPKEIFWTGMILALAISSGIALLKKQDVLVRRLFLVACDIFLFSFATALVFYSDIKNSDTYYGNQINNGITTQFIGALCDLPSGKENFWKCEVKIEAVEKNAAFDKAEGKILLYVRKSGKEFSPVPGEKILFRGQLLEIEKPKNPFEFDYRQYLANKQINHTCFIGSEDYRLLQQTSGNAIWNAGLGIKQMILDRLKNSELSHEAYSICAALLTGYDDDIDSSVMDVFSHSGTIHVLSVSGLHTGLIYLVLSFLFDLFDRKKKYKIGKFIFVTFCLWLLALVTGFSAPVLRAVVMFNLLGLGNIFFRNTLRNRVNILLVSAFVLLLINPFWIADIGFELSYFAVLGILVFQPVFEKIWKPDNRWMNYVWQSTSASFAATLTTLPFTLFYFKQFPLWFFVCNLLVVPLSFVILLLAVFAIFKIGIAVKLINLLVALMISFIGMFNVPGLGFIDNVDFRWIDALFLSLFILIFSIAMHGRNYTQMVYAILVMILWQANGIIDSWNSKKTSGFSAYHINRETSFTVKNRRETLLDTMNKSSYNFHVRPHLVSFNYPEVQPADFNRVVSGKENILLLNSTGKWPKADLSGVTVLVLSQNCKLSENDLSEFVSLKKIVCDGSNNHFTRELMNKLCAKFGLEFYSTKEQGAFLKEL